MRSRVAARKGGTCGSPLRLQKDDYSINEGSREAASVIWVFKERDGRKLSEVTLSEHILVESVSCKYKIQQ